MVGERWDGVGVEDVGPGTFLASTVPCCFDAFVGMSSVVVLLFYCKDAAALFQIIWSGPPTQLHPLDRTAPFQTGLDVSVCVDLCHLKLNCDIRYLPKHRER